MAIKTQAELYNDFVVELQSIAPDLTDTNEGSVIDLIAGAISSAVYEAQILANEEFKKTFFSTANGSEITGNVDDLEYLAVDHFGEDFARPEAIQALGVVQFSRPTTNAGNVTIPAGTIVRTSITSFGSIVRFETISEVVMTGLSISASVRAVIAGITGNVNANTVTSLESTLTDQTVVVNNALAFSGGQAEQNDATYRETIKLLLQTLKGATLSSIEAKAKTVSGVAFAKGIEALLTVRQWDVPTSIASGLPFYLPEARLYISDINGNSSQALIDSVTTAISSNRAAGVVINVYGATAVLISWSATIALNPSGQNYSTLVSDAQMIIDFMNSYLNNLAIGESFSKIQANAAVMAKFGPLGTNDLTSFITTTPSGDVTVAANQKIISSGVTL